MFSLAVGLLYYILLEGRYSMQPTNLFLEVYLLVYRTTSSGRYIYIQFKPRTMRGRRAASKQTTNFCKYLVTWQVASPPPFNYSGVETAIISDMAIYNRSSNLISRKKEEIDTHAPSLARI